MSGPLFQAPWRCPAASPARCASSSPAAVASLPRTEPSRFPRLLYTDLDGTERKMGIRFCNLHKNTIFGHVGLYNITSVPAAELRYTDILHDPEGGGIKVT